MKRGRENKWEKKGGGKGRKNDKSKAGPDRKKQWSARKERLL